MLTTVVGLFGAGFLVGASLGLMIGFEQGKQR